MPNRKQKIEQAVMVCPQCEGEGCYADGLDEAACSITCIRCDSNGWIVNTEALTSIEPIGFVPQLTKQQAAIIGAATNVLCGDINDLKAYAEKLLGKPAFTHSFADEKFVEELKAASRDDFIAMCCTPSHTIERSDNEHPSIFN